jgi:hypothetical protein
MKLSDLNIYDIGGSIGISAIVLGDSRGHFYYVPFPDQETPVGPKNMMDVLEDMDLPNWLKLTKQLDEQEVEILQKDETGKLLKGIVRKTERQIEQRVSWAVYERDHYKCCYCGHGGIPLTVDHLIPWEQGGPSIEANLLTACRKCNKTKGNMTYEEWLKDPFYIRVSKNLTPMQRKVNEDLALTLDNIVRRYQQRSSR